MRNSLAIIIGLTVLASLFDEANKSGYRVQMKKPGGPRPSRWPERR